MTDLENYSVLVACECSGTVRDALISVGIRAISCDLKPTRRPGPHYHGDVRDILYLPHWRGLIAHPVCKYLTNAGAKHLYRRVDGKWSVNHGRDMERWLHMEEAAAFFNLFRNATHIPYRAIENPIPHAHAVALIGRKADQYVQPWWFGDPFSKATGLWLYGLPKLRAEKRKSDYAPGEIKQKCWLMGPSEDREEKRSETEPGLARAIAQQWKDFFGGPTHERRRM
jgi:hypothetical protein